MTMRRICGLISVALITALWPIVATAQAAPRLQQGNSQICVLAFNDQNGNGVRETDEPLLAGVGFTLADSAGVRGSYKTDGNSEPYCFGNLAVGFYTVQARGPAELEATTPGQWAISLANGAQFDVMYGAQPAGAQAANPTTQAPASSSGMTTLGRIALGGLGLVVLLAAGFLAMTAVQRARHMR
jgi:hypothetical protein